MKRIACVCLCIASLAAAAAGDLPAADIPAGELPASGIEAVTGSSTLPSGTEDAAPAAPDSVAAEAPVLPAVRAQQPAETPAMPPARPQPEAAGAPAASGWYKPLCLGAALEANMNSPEGYAVAGGILADWSLSQRMAAGAKFSFSHDFRKTSTAEIVPFFRFYLFDLFPSGGSSGLYVQGDIGTSVFMTGETVVFLNAGATAGYRVLFGSLYVEPYVRAGYPVLWGAGAAAGYSFR